jgi:hypothetical protein
MHIAVTVFQILALLTSAYVFVAVRRSVKKVSQLLAVKDERIATLERQRTEWIELCEKYSYTAGRIQDDRDAAEADVEKLKAQVSQLQVQLAGCGVAAWGGTSPEQVAKQGEFGWSRSYQDVLDLRRAYEAMKSYRQPLRSAAGRAK